MAQAEHPIITRRSLVAATAASAAVPLAARAFTAASEPVLALIVAHEAACLRHEQVCHLLSDLEGEIPEEKRKEWFRGDRAKGLGANDDPRWKAGNDAYWAASDADDEAAWALAHARPATLAGAVALLRYAHDYEAHRREWPNDPEDTSGKIWHATFHASLAAALEGMSG